MVLHNVYETLTHYNDATGEVEALLAKDWSVNETGDVWVFNLRDDVTFHDGTPMTAANVVKSINKTIEMGMGAAYIWDAVESIEQTGNYQVTFTCSYPSPVDPIASAAYASYIISDAAVDQDTEWFNAGNDDGTGPYTIAQANDPEARQDLFAFIWWPDYATPESWFASLVLSEEEICYNLGYIKDEHYDELITETIEKTSTDRDLAIKNYAEVQQGIIDNADIISLYDIVDTFVTSKSISGVYENPAYPASIYCYNVTMN